MARRRSRRERDTTAIATGLPVSRVTPSTLSSLLTPSPSLNNVLQEISDGRRWHPLGQEKPAARFSTGAVASTTLKDRKRTHGRYKGFEASSFAHSQTKAARAFERPTDVDVCVRRYQREQVLHAKRKTGRGGTKRLTTPRRYKADSKIRC